MKTRPCIPLLSPFLSFLCCSSLCCLIVACSEVVPGVEAPTDRFIFPTALELIERSDGLHLWVVNSNFDQAFRTGTVLDLRVDQIMPDILKYSETSTVYFRDDLYNEKGRFLVNSFVRVDSLGTKFSLLSPSSSAVDGGALFALSHRGSNTLSLIDEVKTSSPSRLRCSTEGANKVTNLDCTPARRLHILFQDPNSVAVLPPVNVNGAEFRPAVIGHLGSGIDANTQLPVSALSTLNLNQWEQNIQAESNGQSVSPSPMNVQQLSGFAGVSDVVALSPNKIEGHTLGSVIAVGRSLVSSSGLTLGLFRLIEGTLDDGSVGLGVQLTNSIDLRTGALLLQTRGLLYSAERERLWISVRFQNAQGAFLSGIMTLRVNQQGFTVLSLVRMGKEFGALKQDPESGLLWITDAREDSVFVVDIRSDIPELVHVIHGLGKRIIPAGYYAGQIHSVALLDTPTDVAFMNYKNQRFVWISNFGNSTLALVRVGMQDITDSKVIARLGANLNANGKVEGFDKDP